MDIKVEITKKFRKSLESLPEDIKKRAENLKVKMEKNLYSKGLDYHPIEGAVDKKMHTVYIDNGNAYRAVVASLPKSIYVLLWADSHDKAYRWGLKRRFEYNPEIDLYQDYAEPDNKLSLSKGNYFGFMHENYLLRLGVPKSWIDNVRAIDDKENKLENIKDDLPDYVGEFLQLIIDGESYSSVLELAEEFRNDSKNECINKDLTPMLDIISFPDDEIELKNVMEGPLEEWRIFLHPKQKKLAYNSFNGSVKVLGSAGTGKTVVAMHRAVYLSSLCGPGDKVLYTMYNTHLAYDIEYNVKKINYRGSNTNKIQIQNLDAWVKRYLKEKIPEAKCEYGNNIRVIWEKAINVISDEDLFGIPQFREPKFYMDEWSMVIMRYGIFDMNKYLSVFRAGRGTTLPASKRAVVWKVIKEYMRLLKDKGYLDQDFSYYICRELLLRDPNHPVYKYIVVDECQDFNNIAFDIIRLLAGEKHENDIFIVGDPRQGIYNKTLKLSESDIDVVGRSFTLKIDYRTTEETRRIANDVVKDVYCKDLDGGKYSGKEYISFLHGTEPFVKNFVCQSDEIDFLVSEISRLRQTEKLCDICVVVRKEFFATYKNVLSDKLKEKGINVYDIPNSKKPDTEHEQVHIGTVYQIKGLEYKYIFIVSANADIYPMKDEVYNPGVTNPQAALNKEKSLLHVAISRAQKRVYITSYGGMSPFVKKKNMS